MSTLKLLAGNENLLHDEGGAGRLGERDAAPQHEPAGLNGSARGTGSRFFSGPSRAVRQGKAVLVLASLFGLIGAPGYAQPSPQPSPSGPGIATQAPAPAPAAAPPAAPVPTPATLTVTARGEVSAVPDVANLSIGVTSEGQTAAVALAANAKAASAMIAEIEAAGIPKSDIATTRLAISPNYATRTDQGVERQEISGYTVTNSLNLRIRPIERAGQLIDVLVGRGANSVDSITFEVSDAEKRLDQARVEAAKNAKARAELLAGAAGVRLGRLVDLREGVSAPPVLPNPSVRFDAASAAPPIEPGETRLTASVTATYEILTGAAP